MFVQHVSLSSVVDTVGIFSIKDTVGIFSIKDKTQKDIQCNEKPWDTSISKAWHTIP